jgi:hypothetical protein
MNEYTNTPEKNADESFHIRIADTNRHLAIPASSSKFEPTEDRNIVVPSDEVSAMGTMRWRVYQTFPSRQTMDENIQKTPDAGSSNDKPK